VLEQREFRRVGGSELIPINSRILAATNRDLAAAIAEERFRADLYYRLNVISIHIPPFAERREDIPLLVDHFIEKFNIEMGKEIRGISEGAVRILMSNDWPETRGSSGTSSRGRWSWRRETSSPSPTSASRPPLPTGITGRNRSRRSRSAHPGGPERSPVEHRALRPRARDRPGHPLQQDQEIRPEEGGRGAEGVMKNSIVC